MQKEGQAGSKGDWQKVEKSRKKGALYRIRSVYRKGIKEGDRYRSKKRNLLYLLRCAEWIV